MSTGTNKIRTIKKIDSSEPEFNAEIIRTDDGPNSEKRYIITAERMDDVNWRDDDSLSFAKSQDPTPPRSDGSRTILKTTADGRTWLAIPNRADPLDLTDTVPCIVQTSGITISRFETDTKQNALDPDQLSNIEAVPSKADRSVVDNKVDIRAVTYTDAQKTQARNNIAAASITQGTKADNSVQFVSQTLTDAQKTQARTNIAAASITQGTKADNSVQFVSQTLTDAQKTMARTNINAVDGSIVDTTATADRIVKRIAGGQITLPTSPSAGTDATSKSYVDAQLGLKINVAQGAANVGKSLVVNSSGNLEVQPHPTAPVTSVAGKAGVVTLVKGDVGLGSVDNTSDVSKPVSTATQNALNNKQFYSNGTCATAIGTIDKTVTVPNVTAYAEGMRIEVLFTLGTSALSSATLNVNSLGAGQIRFDANSNYIPYLPPYTTVVFTRFGTYWYGVTSGNSKKGIQLSVATAAATAAKVTATNYGVAQYVIGQDYDVTFTLGSTSTAMTLNINSLGAKTVYYNGLTIMPVINANEIVRMHYDGTFLRIVGITAGDLATKQDKNLSFSNVSVTTNLWSDDSTNASYPCKATIALSGVLAAMIPEVLFSSADARGRNFSTYCESAAGTVTIWARVKPTATVTIPAIMLTKP